MIFTAEYSGIYLLVARYELWQGEVSRRCVHFLDVGRLIRGAYNQCKVHTSNLMKIATDIVNCKKTSRKYDNNSFDYAYYGLRLSPDDNLKSLIHICQGDTGAVIFTAADV